MGLIRLVQPVKKAQLVPPFRKAPPNPHDIPYFLSVLSSVASTPPTTYHFEMSTETKANLVKMKPSGQDGSSKGKFDAAMNKRKLESSSKQPVGAKQKSATTKAEREPLRIFYESLSKQIPKSEMAEFWMMEHGLLSPEKDRKAYEKKQRRQKQLRTGTPIKSWKPSGKPESSQKQQLARGMEIKNKLEDHHGCIKEVEDRSIIELLKAAMAGEEAAWFRLLALVFFFTMTSLNRRVNV
ncbi:hypothetical protein GOBAR_DD30241 [Gossypium barbadense]|nr:hypothetical protein GOBAR_DD30241 [Gossypium barbadense]